MNGSFCNDQIQSIILAQSTKWKRYQRQSYHVNISVPYLPVSICILVSSLDLLSNCKGISYTEQHREELVFVSGKTKWKYEPLLVTEGLVHKLTTCSRSSWILVRSDLLCPWETAALPERPASAGRIHCSILDTEICQLQLRPAQKRKGCESSFLLVLFSRCCFVSWFEFVFKIFFLFPHLAQTCFYVPVWYPDSKRQTSHRSLYLMLADQFSPAKDTKQHILKSDNFRTFSKYWRIIHGSQSQLNKYASSA